MPSWQELQFGDRGRITGMLVLDCGHGLLHNCDEDDAGTQNQEIHPVYTIDFVQNFRIRQPIALLTGAWIADDASAYVARPGPRIVDSLEILAGILHPQEFQEFARPPRAAGRVSPFSAKPDP